MKFLLIALLSLYQKLISPLLVHTLGHSCRFLPTCSEYAREAISTHGVIKGVQLSLRRIARCHPGTPFTFDPVNK